MSFSFTYVHKNIFHLIWLQNKDGELCGLNYNKTLHPHEYEEYLHMFAFNKTSSILSDVTSANNGMGTMECALTRKDIRHLIWRNHSGSTKAIGGKDNIS